MPFFIESTTCCKKFGDKYQAVTSSKYEKSNVKIYNKLNQYGDEEKALRIAKQRYQTSLANKKVKPSEMCSVTTLYQLVGEIRGKIINNNAKK